MKPLFSLLYIGILMNSLTVSAQTLSLSSTDIKAGQVVPAEYHWNQFGCTGKNIMPALVWKNLPGGTQSLAITVYDRDAPTGSGFWHWTIYNIPAHVSSLPGGVDAGPLPEGAVQGYTDLNKPGFFGPCPPIGRQHRYVYTVIALKVKKLEAPPSASPALLGFLYWQNTLAKASFEILAGPRKE
jgi:Raf kinase inhibitor-like YbhB/YbcL family protein